MLIELQQQRNRPARQDQGARNQPGRRKRSKVRGRKR